MPKRYGPIARPFHFNGPPSILARYDNWSGHSYTFDSASMPDWGTTGVKHLHPGMLVMLNPATRMLIPATSSYAPGTYKTWPILTFYDITGDEHPIVEVVEAGEVVERYCFGYKAAGTYTADSYGHVSASVKAALPAVIWK